MENNVKKESRVPYMIVTEEIGGGVMHFCIASDIIHKEYVLNINHFIDDLIEYYKGKIEYIKKQYEDKDDEYDYEVIRCYENYIKKLEKLSVILDMMMLNNPNGDMLRISYEVIPNK